jgi:hypothetical protein
MSGRDTIRTPPPDAPDMVELLADYSADVRDLVDQLSDVLASLQVITESIDREIQRHRGTL